MEILIVVIALFAAVMTVVLIRLSKRLPDKEGDNQGLLLMQQQLQDIRKTLDARLDESTRRMQTQFGESAKIIRDVTERLTKLDETNKQVVNFADQLRNLQDILKNPKQRGVLGEYYLKTLLENVLPPGTFQMQYAFKDGTIVDAAIFVKDKIIPVDSKFSLENYNRILETRDELELRRLEEAFRGDIKLRIDETAKYVKPNEGTLEFAFMFIPAEAIYYDLLINKVGATKSNTRDLIEYAVRDKKVIIVSPTSFLAYLQTVLQGLKSMQIEESAKEIRKGVEDLSKHLRGYDEYMEKLGGHLGTAVNTYNKAYKEFGKIDKDIVRIGAKAAGVEPKLIERPSAHEELEE